ncbi:MAG: hypothetical protein AAFX93_17685 [Verrucomicrobiota bacterium]
MIAVLLVALIIISTVTLYLRSAVQEMRYAERTFALQQTVNLAEMGAEHAIWAINNDDWTSWTGVATDQYHISYDANTGETVTVYADVRSSSEVWIASSGVVDVSGKGVEKQLLMKLEARGLFANGLTAREFLRFNGNNIDIDSYNSENGVYDPVNNRGDQGTVASASVAVNSVTIQNANIYGFVATTGGTPILGPNGTVTGSNTPAGVSVDQSRIATDFYAEFPDVTAPATTGAASAPVSGTMGTAGTATTYTASDLTIKSKDTITVEGDVTLVITDDLDIRGSIVINPNSSLTLYVNDDISIAGNGVANMSARPQNFLIYGTGDRNGFDPSYSLGGNAQLQAAVYAPHADITLNGGGSSGVFLGAAVGNNITFNGHVDFHYDESLKSFSPDSQFRLTEWRELTAAADRLPIESGSSMAALSF